MLFTDCRTKSKIIHMPWHPYLRLLLRLVLRVKEERHISHEWGCQLREIQLWDLVGLELFLELHCCKVFLKGLAQSEGTAHNLRFILGETRCTHIKLQIHGIFEVQSRESFS